MKPSQRTMLAAAALSLLFFAGACSSKPFLIVHYQLPSPSNELEGHEASPVITDIRENKTFLSESAKKSLQEFNETYSLVVLEEDGSGNLLGVYEIDALLAEIFKQRLRNLNMQEPPLANKAEFDLEIRLREFKLDLVGRKWIFRMNYQANLLKNGRLLATESVNGSAERLKVMSKSDAEKVLSEMLTDLVNKLDLAKLFQQARR